MKKVVLSALLCMMAVLSYAQKATDGAARAETELALAMPSRDRGRQKSTTDAAFPGGNEALVQFIYDNLRYPVDCLQKDIHGVVNVTIEITKDGSIGKTTIDGSPHQSMSDEVLRIIKLLPKWIPAQKDGKNVSSEVTLPIAFRLSSGEVAQPKPAQVECAEKPETIVTFVAKQHEPEWYTAQTMAWQKEVDKNPHDEWAWRNLFQAAYYDDIFNCKEGVPQDEMRTTDVLRKMQDALPDSYVLNLSKLRFCLPGDTLAYTSYHALRAIELMPENAHSEDITKLACRMWQTEPDNAVAKELFTRGYKLQHFPSRMMQANWNMLQSMQPEAIYFANGDAVTMPMKMLQCALDVRTDVTVIPIPFLYDEEFCRALYKKLNITPFSGNYRAYFEKYGSEGDKQYEVDAMMHIIHASKRPSYFSTYNILYNTLNKDSLYNEGLLLKWSDHPYDNFAVAMHNVKNVYHLEYLAEPNLVYDSWEASSRMDLNHITQLAHLIGKLRKAGDSKQADRLYHILSTCLELHDAEPERMQYYRETLEKQQTGNGE